MEMLSYPWAWARARVRSPGRRAAGRAVAVALGIGQFLLSPLEAPAQEPPRAATPGRPGAGLPDVATWAPEGPPPPLRPAEERSFVDPAQPVLTLAQAQALALRQHPQLSAAAAAALAAEARVYQARAGWLPQVGASASLSGSYTYQTGLADGIAERSQARYNTQITVSQLITDFTRTPARLSGARATARAIRSDLNQSRAQIALNAVTAYCAVLQAEALYESVALNLAQQRQRLTQAESFVQIGTRPEIDALTARTAVAQAELQLVQAQNNVVQGRVQLLLSLGVTDPTWLRRPLQAPSVEDAAAGPAAGELPAEMLDAALATRPDVQALRERVTAAEQSLRAVRAQYYPTLSANGGAGMSGNIGGPSTGNVGGQVLTNVPTNGAPIFSVSGALTLNWNAFDGLLTPYQVREAEAQLAQARANLEATRQQVRGTLQQALFGVQTARQSLRAAEAVLRQAELQRETAMGRYQAGVGNIIEVGDALAGAANARAQRAQAEFNLAVARATLQFQAGTLVPASAGSDAQGGAASSPAPEGVR